MGELISRAAAIEAIDAWHIDYKTVDGARVHTECFDAIKALPAVDAVPVVHGIWLRWHWAWLVCNQCNEKMLVKKSNHGYIQQFPHNYCPNCGAKMDGERRVDDGTDA